MDPLGKPVGGDDHGAGLGVSGGPGASIHPGNSQAAKMAQEEQTGFNAGVGGAHASGGIPFGHQHTSSTGSNSSNTPIADKFMTGGNGTGATGTGSSGTGAKLDNSLDNFSGHAGSGTGAAGTAGAAGAGGLTGAGAGALAGSAAGTGAGAGSGGLGGGSAVSGAYEGGEARDALTGQSRAHETGPGVGYGGDNLREGNLDTSGNLRTADRLDAAGAEDRSALGPGAAAGAGAGAAGLAGAGAYGASKAGSKGDDAAGTGHAYGTGVGAEGGAGGHYDTKGAGGAGAGAAGAGAAGAAAAGAGAGAGAATGRYGTAEKDFDRGAPLSDPKALDTGGPHSLVLDPATGKYIHRHEKEGGALQDEVTKATRQ